MRNGMRKWINVIWGAAVILLIAAVWMSGFLLGRIVEGEKLAEIRIKLEVAEAKLDERKDMLGEIKDHELFRKTGVKEARK